jgi:hypothetical protein
LRYVSVDAIADTRTHGCPHTVTVVVSNSRSNCTADMAPNIDADSCADRDADSRALCPTHCLAHCASVSVAHTRTHGNANRGTYRHTFHRANCVSNRCTDSVTVGVSNVEPVKVTVCVANAVANHVPHARHVPWRAGSNQLHVGQLQCRRRQNFVPWVVRDVLRVPQRPDARPAVLQVEFKRVFVLCWRCCYLVSRQVRNVPIAQPHDVADITDIVSHSITYSGTDCATHCVSHDRTKRCADRVTNCVSHGGAH